MHRQRRPPSPSDPKCRSPSPTSAQPPVKPFQLPLRPVRNLLTLSSKLLIDLVDLLGFAKHSRRIICVPPRVATRLHLREGSEADYAEWVERNVPCLRGEFRPSWWLPNGHLQTIFSVKGNFKSVDKVDYERTYLRTPDGGTIGLDFSPPSHDALLDGAPTIVVCHGLSGGSDESYVRNALAWIVRAKPDGGLGARAVVINSRGCAGVPVTSPRLFSAGTTIDLALTLHYLRAHFPSSPLHGLGFSLGASVLARYLGETGSRSLLSSGFVLGCPWDLPAMETKLEHHWFISTVYSPAMGADLLDLFFRGYDRDPSVWEDGAVKEFVPAVKAMRGKKRRLKQVDDVMISKFGGPWDIGLWPFESADAYYEWASPKHVLRGVKRPLLVLNAFDDPINDGNFLPIKGFESSSHIYAAITGGGGHLGWFSGPLFGSASKSRWSIEPVAEFLNAACRDLSASSSAVEVKKDGKGWEWVEKEAHAMSGVGGDGQVGWKVILGEEIRKGEGRSGPLQGS